MTTSSVSLAWNASAGATSYTVRRNGANPVTVTGTSTTVTGLAANTSYSFTVSASQQRRVVSPVGTGHRPRPPVARTQCRRRRAICITGSTCTSVSLAWNASTGATSYRVYRGTTLAATVTGTTSTTITGLSARHGVRFRVSAVNAAGESAQSAALNVTTPGCPQRRVRPRAWPYIDVTLPTPDDGVRRLRDRAAALHRRVRHRLGRRLCARPGAARSR